jgi:putative ABC transport system permease protein
MTDPPLVVQRAAVTGGWFELLGVRARAGRLIAAADDHAGAAPVVVVSSGFAERLFDRVESAVGRRLRIQEGTYTVVGLTPADFDYPRNADVWLPAVGFRDIPEVAWDLVVRVAPGFTSEQTVSDLTTALRNMSSESGPLGSTADLVMSDERKSTC